MHGADPFCTVRLAHMLKPLLDCAKKFIGVWALLKSAHVRLKISFHMPVPSPLSSKHFCWYDKAAIRTFMLMGSRSHFRSRRNVGIVRQYRRDNRRRRGL